MIIFPFHIFPDFAQEEDEDGVVEEEKEEEEKKPKTKKVGIHFVFLDFVPFYFQ